MGAIWRRPHRGSRTQLIPGEHQRNIELQGCELSVLTKRDPQGKAHLQNCQVNTALHPAHHNPLRIPAVGRAVAMLGCLMLDRQTRESPNARRGLGKGETDDYPQQ
jgi:hypothetical protein